MICVEMESGGYDVKFVDTVSHCFKCVICHFVLKNPVLFVECGHRLCSICFNGIKDTAVQNKRKLQCPLDRAEIDLEKVYEDKGIARAVLDLKVTCNNSSGGCQWVGELRHLQGHLDGSCENAIPRQLMKRIEACEAQLKKKDEEINGLCKVINSLHKHMMNVDEYVPNVRTVFVWKLNITSYEAPIFSPKFYSKLHGHYCMLRVAFISVPSKSGGAKSVRFGIYFHITKGVNGEECTEPFNMKINIEVRNKNGKMDTFQFTKEDVQKQNEKPKKKEKKADAAPKPAAAAAPAASADSAATGGGDGGGAAAAPVEEVKEEEEESEEEDSSFIPADLSKFVINDCLTIKCTLLHNQS